MGGDLGGVLTAPLGETGPALEPPAGLREFEDGIVVVQLHGVLDVTSGRTEVQRYLVREKGPIHHR